MNPATTRTKNNKRHKTTINPWRGNSQLAVSFPAIIMLHCLNFYGGTYRKIPFARKCLLPVIAIKKPPDKLRDNHSWPSGMPFTGGKEKN